MLRMFLIVLLLVGFSFNGYAARKENKPIPKIYKEKVRKMLDNLSNMDELRTISPLTLKEQDEYKEAFSMRDRFLYSPQKKLKKTNKQIKINMRSNEIIKIKLGHTFTTSLIFTDAMGNPWSVDTLTDISNKSVVSVQKKANNIITVRPLVKGGETNLPIKLVGEQRPITLLFEINDEEVYFDVDLIVDGIGDNKKSQQQKVLSSYLKGNKRLAKLSLEPDITKMLHGVTPNGFNERVAYNEYKQKLDLRDFMVWTKGDKLYILTPYDYFSPEPIDINASSDGRYKLMVYDNTPILAVRENAKVFWLNIE